MKPTAVRVDIKENDKWKVEDDLRTLINADEIKKDKKRMEACKELAKEKMAGMKKIGEHKGTEEAEETEET